MHGRRDPEHDSHRREPRDTGRDVLQILHVIQSDYVEVDS